MRSFRDVFGSLFGRPAKEKTPGPHGHSPSPQEPMKGTATGQAPVTPYKKGDLIGQNYEVHRVLGRGGFGVVYLVYSHETDNVYALKTFRDEYLADAVTRKRFLAEANVWVELDRHPYLVRAYFVDEVAGRLYIAMEYIAPDEHGLNTLEGYLRRRPPDLAQALRWAVQFCHGMEYAYSRGIRSHRDIKPANIMISQDRTVKIADFGLASVLSGAGGIGGVGLTPEDGRARVSAQTMEGASFGTPTHMPPEQFTDAAGCDERSDIYAFGVVLYQMATGGQPPFLASLPRDGSQREMVRFWQEMHRLHSQSRVPRLDSPLFPLIQRCLAKDPAARYQSFQELRRALEPLLRREAGEVIRPPDAKALEAWEWNNKGLSLRRLGRYEEAIRCFDRALEIDPKYAFAWNNKGNSLQDLSRLEEAIRCYDSALEIDPQHSQGWNNKGLSLANLGRYEEAIQCCERALKIDPQDAATWNNRGRSLANLGRHAEAIRCFDRALEIDPQHVFAWNNRGGILHSLGRYEEAIQCYERALQIDPQYANGWYHRGNSLYGLSRYEEAIRCYDRALEIDPKYAEAWYDKGRSLTQLGRYEEGVQCYERALQIDPRLARTGSNRHAEAIRCFDRTPEINPQDATAWYDQGVSLYGLGRYEEAAQCYHRALQIDPKYAKAWNNRGASLHSLGRHAEAIRCFDRALEIDPQYAEAWCNRALVEDRLGHTEDAARCYQQFLDLAPPQHAAQIEHARQRLQQLRED